MMGKPNMPNMRKNLQVLVALSMCAGSCMSNGLFLILISAHRSEAPVAGLVILGFSMGVTWIANIAYKNLVSALPP